MAISNRGFASMDSKKQRIIASKGGKTAHMKGKAHQFTREEAIKAGRKGGEIRAHHKDVISGALGRKGAAARWGTN